MDAGRPGITVSPLEGTEPDSVHVVYKQHHETVKARLVLHPKFEFQGAEGQKISNDLRDLTERSAVFTMTDGGVFLFGWIDPQPEKDGAYVFRFFYGAKALDVPELSTKRTTWGQIKGGE